MSGAPCEAIKSGYCDRIPSLCNAVVLNGKTVGGERAIKIAAYLGWSWVEWGGVGLARLQFWLQKADFGLLRMDGILVTY